MEFEWDEDKRQSNLIKHAVDFEEMQALFDGRPIITVPSTSTVEERFLTTGIVEKRFYTVVWTKRGNVRLGSFQQGGHVMAKSERIVRYTANRLRRNDVEAKL